MKTTKKILSTVLCFIMLVVMLSSCKNDKKENSQVDVSNGSQVESVAEELVPQLEKRDLDGFELVILGPKKSSDSSYEECQLNTDEMNDEPVNDALYTRNRKIEQEYNCKIKAMIPPEGTTDGVIGMVRNSIASGSADFNLIGSDVFGMKTLALEGSLYDYNKLENSNLKLDQAWWDQSFMRDVTINNMLHYVTGDIVVTDDEATWAVYFNKDIIESLSLEDPFTLVRDGKWTLDKMNEMSKAAKMDDGDGKMTVDGDDQWGFIADTYDGLAFMWGTQQSMVKKDANDIPSFRVSEQSNIDAWQKVFTLVGNEDYSSLGYHHYSWDDPLLESVFYNNFVKGNALFCSRAISFVSSEVMRNAEIKYGILPMPKYDENQAEYSSSATVYWLTVLSIPTTNTEIDKTTYIMEAMAYRGYKDVTPEYYDKTLKNKRFQDNDSPEMLDLIFRNRTYDLSAIYNWGDSMFLYPYMLGDRDSNIMSRIEASLSNYETYMNETIEGFKALTQ